MAEPFLGEIRMFAGNFAPRNFALCDGQLLGIIQNDALFSLVGTTYGGDGRTTFALPDLRGRIPIHKGYGPGLTSRNLGAKGGSETVALNASHLPSHTHPLRASTDPATESRPADNVLAGDVPVDVYRSTAEAMIAMDATSTTEVGGGQSHANVQPFLCINFIIALWGIYPPMP